MPANQVQEDPVKAERLLSLLNPEQRDLVATRRSFCKPCGQNKRLHQITVICKAGGCAGISLIHGRCKLRRWPAPGSDSNGTPITMPPPPPPPPEEPEWMSRPAVAHAAHQTPRNTAAPGTPINDVFIYGFPGLYAGANTELHHQIVLWRSMGLSIHLIPSDPGYRNEALYPEMIERGVTVHEADDFDAILPGAPVLGFCNDRFLTNLDRILERSHNTVFVNCMTWLFEMEKRRHREGKLAAFLYQNDAVRQKSQVALQAINPDADVQYLTFKPYFNAEAYPFVDRRADDRFAIGHISRQDADKFAADTLRIWESIEVPGAVPKRGIMLGFGRPSEEKIGMPADWITTYENQNTLSQQDFYARTDVIVQPTDTTENWPRIGLEAMASGTVLIVDNRGGWQQMIEHGKTGWLCDTPEDFITYATRMAHEPEERRALARAARERLDQLAGASSSKESWLSVLDELGVRPSVPAGSDS
ncbi:MAG: glycosyltransferase [Planctomycetota bacterium]